MRRQWKDGKITFSLDRLKRVSLLRGLRRYRDRGSGGDADGGGHEEEGEFRENAETRPLLG